MDTLNSENLRIAFGCEARVGKDTAVDYLIEKYGGKRLSFAKPLYDILHYAQGVCGFKREKDRTFLQWVGTEWARAQNSEVWVNCMLKTLLEPENQEINLFVSDLRFPNEFDALKKEGFVCVRIIGPQRGETVHKNHISETSLLDYDWDYTITNNNSFDDFFESLDLMIKRLKPTTLKS